MTKTSAAFVFMFRYYIVIALTTLSVGCGSFDPEEDFGPQLAEEALRLETDPGMTPIALDQGFEMAIAQWRLATPISDEGEEDDEGDEGEDGDDDDDGDDGDDLECFVDDECEPVRGASFCSESLSVVTCDAGSDCTCPAGEWCLLECPDGGCTFRWGEGACATLDCPSCDCNLVPPPPGFIASASACWSRGR